MWWFMTRICLLASLKCYIVRIQKGGAWERSSVPLYIVYWGLLFKTFHFAAHLTHIPSFRSQPAGRSGCPMSVPREPFHVHLVFRDEGVECEVHSIVRVYRFLLCRHTNMIYPPAALWLLIMQLGHPGNINFCARINNIMMIYVFVALQCVNKKRAFNY